MPTESVSFHPLQLSSIDASSPVPHQASQLPSTAMSLILPVCEDHTMSVPGVDEAEASDQPTMDSTSSIVADKELPPNVLKSMQVVENTGDRVDKIGLPKYSDRVRFALETGKIVIELDKFIEETAYHIIRNGDMTSKADYQAYGRVLYDAYPCINFESRTGDTSPWVS